MDNVPKIYIFVPKSVIIIIEEMEYEKTKLD